MRALQLKEMDPSPRWFKLVMLMVGCLILVSTPFFLLIVGSPGLFNVGGIGVGLSFLLILGADRLPEPRGTAAALVRLVGILLLAAGMLLALGSVGGKVL